MINVKPTLAGAALVTLVACAASSPPQPTEPARQHAVAPVAPASPPVLEEMTRAIGALEIDVSQGGGELQGQGLRLLVDGQVFGALPGRFGLAAGQHELEIRDDEQRYAVFSQAIHIGPNTETVLTPLLVVKRGLITFRLAPDAEGSVVRLKKGAEVRPMPTVPIRIDFADENLQGYTFEVESPSGQKRSYPVDFSDGVAKKIVLASFAAPNAKVGTEMGKAGPLNGHEHVSSGSRGAPDERSGVQ